MKLGSWDFKPGLVPTVAAVAMIALTLYLANWQDKRASEKAALQAVFEARALEAPLVLTGQSMPVNELRYRRLRAEGRYLPEGQVYLDNRQHAGRAGFHVITPLRPDAGGTAVLVNRGWVARTSAYPQPPDVPVPEGRVRVDGLATVPPARFLELSPDTVSGRVWQNLSVAKYRERLRLDVLPVVLLASQPAPGLAVVEEKPDAGIAKHQEYALTWLSLAITVAALWIVLNLKRTR